MMQLPKLVIVFNIGRF